MSCSRRDFLKGMSACFAGGLMGPGTGLMNLPGTNVKYSASPRQAPGGGNIVVFVQMYGGNDGLNMVYPLNGTQRTNYEEFRPTLKLPILSTEFQPWIDKGISSGDVALDIGVNADGNNYAFNPGMGALHQLYLQGKVAMLPGVHYPNANHSHFESSNIYTSADPGASNIGWFSKYLNSAASGYGTLDVPTVIMGGSQAGLFSPSLPGIFTFERLNVLRFPATNETALKAMVYNDYCDIATTRDGSQYPELVKIAQTAHATISHLTDYYKPSGGASPYVPAKVQALLADKNGRYQRGNPLVYSSPFNEDVNPKVMDNDLATDLKHVAAIIRADVGARFFHVSINGFDTHSDQEKNLNHSSMLNEISEAVAAFYVEMSQAVTLPGSLSGYQTGSLIDNVLIVTFSEFGRTISQNASEGNEAGTDHAASAPQLIIGGKVTGGQYGAYPQIDDPGSEAEDDLKMTTDFRDVFGTVLNKWLSVPVEELGPGQGKILNTTPKKDADGKDYMAYTPLSFI